MTSPRRCWASACSSLARVEKLHGDADAARAAIDEAIDLSGEMTAARVEHARRPDQGAGPALQRSDLAVTRGDTARGLEDARTAVDIGRPLSQAEPADKELQTLLADALERSGNIAGGINTAFATPRRLDPALPPISQGIDNVAALAAYEESARIFRRQVAEDFDPLGCAGPPREHPDPRRRPQSFDRQAGRRAGDAQRSFDDQQRTSVLRFRQQRLEATGGGQPSEVGERLYGAR